MDQLRKEHIKSILLIGTMGMCVVTTSVFSSKVKCMGLDKLKKYERVIIDITNCVRDAGARILMEELYNYARPMKPNRR